jgi:hypothetical protein
VFCSAENGEPDWFPRFNGPESLEKPRLTVKNAFGLKRLDTDGNVKHLARILALALGCAKPEVARSELISV